MPLFKLQARNNLALRERIATLSPGPFLVEAPSEHAARALVDQNFGGLCPRDHDGRRQAPVWLNAGASNCTALNVAAGSIASQKQISGRTDVASWLIETRVTMHAENESARMVWWPFDPDEPCPI